jgi:hypothetical protein
MKFFSNDAKENSDEPYGRDHGDVVTSDPVAVPQQRAGSPWSDAPADASTTDDVSRSDVSSADASTTDASTTGDEAGSPEDELAEQQPRDETDEEPAGRRDETATVTTYHPDGTVESQDGEDGAVRDEDTFASPQAVETATGETLGAESDEPADEPDEPESDPALRRDVAEAPAEPDDTAAEEAPVAAATAAAAAEAAAPAAPGSVSAAPLDRLFSDGDSFAERFREIQLRFVDSPKEATADAAALVGEAVDKLTSALQAQKDTLGGDSDDTEQLRVQLRSYRDLLNRLSAL